MAGLRLLFHFERFCCALASWFPRVGVNLLTTWGIYTHIFHVCLVHFTGFLRFVFIFFGLAFYVLSTVSYYRTVSCGPGSPLEIQGFLCRDLEEGSYAPPPQVFNNVTAKDNGEMRFCSKCNCWKPDRTHHCSSCKRCILRMDHHCPWFSACIGFKNHKFFIMFLSYVSLLCVVCFVSSMWTIMDFFKNEEVYHGYLSMSWVALVVVSGVMGLAVIAFTGFSLYQVFNNTTTIESLESVKYRSSVPADGYRYRAPPSSETVGNIFDLGWKRNWMEVMGYRWLEWILPVHPKNMSDGTSFPINEEVWEDIKSSADSEMEFVERQRQYQLRQKEIQRREMQLELQENVESIPLTSMNHNDLR